MDEREGDRHPGQADDLRKCFAGGAVTAFRVWDLAHLARTRAGEPACRFVGRDGITGALRAGGQAGRPQGPGATGGGPGDDAMEVMREGRFTVLTGGLAGFHPSKRQPLPGTETLWQGVRTLAESVFAIRTWEDIRMERDDTGSSMLH